MRSLAVSSKSFIPEDNVKSESRINRTFEITLSDLAVNEGQSLLVSGTFTDNPARFISSQNRFC